VRIRFRGFEREQNLYYSTRDPAEVMRASSYIVTGVVLTLGATTILYAASGMTRSSQTSASPEETARDFYKWYVHALYESPQADPLTTHKSDVEKYVTVRLLQKLASSRRTSTVRKGPDVDTEYFLQTLDLNSEWEQYINVSRSTMKGAMAVVHLTLSGTNPESTRLDIERDLKVVLKQEGGPWKIDDVGVWRE
jgi:hypothetical protein